MENSYYIECISKGVENYLQVLGKASNMIHHQGDIEWIAPISGTPGPSIVFKLTLKNDTANKQIKDILLDVTEKKVPSAWFITPISKPENIVDILIKNGFPDSRVCDNSDEGEPAMALDLVDFVNTSSNSVDDIEIIIVKTIEEFSQWINVVNEALHGWDMLLAKNCYNLIALDGVVFYLAYLDGKPVATAATMRYGQSASLEFVSTLKDYQRKGIGSVLCTKILDDLRECEVTTVTLRSSDEAKSLYKKLGFKKYFNTTVLIYKS